MYATIYSCFENIVVSVGIMVEYMIHTRGGAMIGSQVSKVVAQLIFIAHL